MSLADRQQFLKNAERWKLMKPAEREAWRELVKEMSLLPPIIDAPPRPPSPPAPRHGPTPTVATNGG